MHNNCPCCVKLRARVEELEVALGLTADIPQALVPAGLVTRHRGPRVLIGILLARPFGDRHAVFDVMYGGRPEADQPDPKILDIMVSQARKALRPHGIEIETIWGKGWRMTPDNKAKLRGVIAALSVACGQQSGAVAVSQDL